MSKKLGLFPLGLVLFPKEGLNLHIFEPRYRELVADCLKYDLTFGIVPHINGKLYHTGTEVRIISVEHQYPDGRYDIKTLALERFELQDFTNPWEPHLYAGGTVTLLEKEFNKGNPYLINVAYKLAEKFGTLAQLEMSKPIEDSGFYSWQIGHKIGLSGPMEASLLSILHEDERLEFIIAHLEQIIPILEEVKQSQERSKLNGHFKFFEPINY